MENLIALIRRNESVTDEDARRVFSVLHPVVMQAPTDGDAHDVAAKVIQRMEHSSPLAAILDWWLVVATGGAPAAGMAYALPDTIPAALREQMSEALNLSTPIPVATWLHRHGEFEQALNALDERLSLDWYGKAKLPSERQAWASVIEEFSPTITALQDDVPAPLPSLSETHLERYLKDAHIEQNSRRWKEMVKRADQLEEYLTTCVELQQQVEPWVARTPPTLIDLTDPAIGFDASSLEARLLQPISATPPADGTDIFATVMGEIARIAADGDRSELTAIARITDSWYQTVSGSMPVTLRVPDYDSVVAQLHRIEQDIASLSASGIDMTDADLAVLSDDLDGADRAITAARQSQRQTTAQSALSTNLAALRERAATLGLSELVADDIARAQTALDDGETEAAREALAAVDRRIDNETRSAAIARLELLAADLERLSAERDDLTALAELIHSVHNGARVDPAATGRFERLMNDLVDQHLDEATDDLASIEAMIPEVSHDATTERLGWEAKLDDLTTRLAATRQTRILDDVILVAEEAAHLFEEIEKNRIVRWVASMGEEPLVEHIVDYCTQQMAFGVTDIHRFYVAVKTKPFVILAGLTGSGKSTIVRLFAESIGATAANRGFRRIAVRPDWIDQSEVLGYINPLSNVFQPGWLARVMRECNDAPNRMFVVLLDELNLAPVEQYLAEYLSAGEEARSGSQNVRIPLYPEGSHIENGDEWPAELTFPDNLIIVGTVNMDETTRVLSDRVLDRANVLQLDVGISRDHHAARPISVSPWDVPFTEWRRICRREPAVDYHDLLVDIADLMRTGLRIGLGVRAHIEIERFVANADGVIDQVDALDLAMLQRVIPKIKGFKRDLHDGLDDLEDLLTTAGAQRCARVIADWLDDSVPDDEYLDGTSHRVGLLS